MAEHLKDAVVVTGSYTDRDGNEKKRYKKIGRVMKGDGGSFLLLDRTFNPAGIDVEEGRDSIIVSFYDPEPREGGGQQQRQAPARQAPAKRAPAKQGGFDEMDDDIPY